MFFHTLSLLTPLGAFIYNALMQATLPIPTSPSSTAIPDRPVLPQVYAKFAGISIPTVRALARRGLLAIQMTPSGQIRVLPEAFVAVIATRRGP